MGRLYRIEIVTPERVEALEFSLNSLNGRSSVNVE